MSLSQEAAKNLFALRQAGGFESGPNPRSEAFEDNDEVGVYLCVEILGLQDRKQLKHTMRDRLGHHPHFLLDLRRDSTSAVSRKEPVKIGIVTLLEQLPLYLMGLLVKFEEEESSLPNPFNPEVKEPQHFWAHINRGLWLLRCLEYSAATTKGSRGIEDFKESPLRRSHTEAVLDTIRLCLLYSIRWLGNQDLWKHLKGNGDQVSYKVGIFQITLHSLSLFEDYFTWSYSDRTFYIHATDILQYRTYHDLNLLIQTCFDAITLLTKNIKLFQLEYCVLQNNFKHLWHVETNQEDMKQICTWYYERLCSILSFFTRQFLYDAFYSLVMKSRDNVVSILKVMLNMLDGAISTAIGNKIDFLERENSVYLLLRVLDLLEVFMEKEEPYFLDLAMADEKTKDLLEGVVGKIQKLYVLVCIHIRGKMHTQDYVDVVPRMLVNAFESSLFRIVQNLADDSNFREYMVKECQMLTYILCNVDRKHFYDYWLNIEGSKFMKEANRGLNINMFGGFELGIYCLQARETFDILNAGLGLYGYQIGGSLDLWHYEKTLSLYKIILDMHNAKRLAARPEDFEDISKVFNDTSQIRSNIFNLLMFGLNNIPSNLLLVEEAVIVESLCADLSLPRWDLRTEAGSITALTGGGLTAVTYVAESDEKQRVKRARLEGSEDEKEKEKIIALNLDYSEFTNKILLTIS